MYMSRHLISCFIGIVPEPVPEDGVSEEGFGVFEETVYHCQQLFPIIATYIELKLWRHTKIELRPRGIIRNRNAHEPVEPLGIVISRAGGETDAP